MNELHSHQRRKFVESAIQASGVPPTKHLENLLDLYVEGKVGIKEIYKELRESGV